MSNTNPIYLNEGILSFLKGKNAKLSIQELESKIMQLKKQGMIAKNGKAVYKEFEKIAQLRDKISQLKKVA